MWALIFIVYIQNYQSLSQDFLRYDIIPNSYVTEKSCKEEGEVSSGSILEETQPLSKFVWRDYTCVNTAEK